MELPAFQEYWDKKYPDLKGRMYLGSDIPSLAFDRLMTGVGEYMEELSRHYRKHYHGSPYFKGPKVG